MRVFKTKRFARSGIPDKSLAEAVERAERGLIDVDLGGGVIKQRVARPREGRSGGYRTLIAYRKGKISVFLHAFAKKDQDNITRDELLSLRELADGFFAADATALKKALTEGVLIEVEYGEANEEKNERSEPKYSRNRKRHAKGRSSK